MFPKDFLIAGSVPNNYTHDSLKPFGKTRRDQIFAEDPKVVSWKAPSRLSRFATRLQRRASTYVGLQ